MSEFLKEKSNMIADVENNVIDISSHNSSIASNANRLNALEANINMRQSVALVDSASYSFTTTWSLGPSFTNITDFQAGSKIKLHYSIPCRNDTAAWGGIYIEPQLSLNDGVSWASLGSSGYSTVMVNSATVIGHYSNTILIDPEQTSVFSVKFRFYAKAYAGIATINSSNDLTSISNTASLMSGINGTQHYASIVVDELIN